MTHPLPRPTSGGALRCAAHGEAHGRDWTALAAPARVARTAAAASLDARAHGADSQEPFASACSPCVAA